MKNIYLKNRREQMLVKSEIILILHNIFTHLYTRNNSEKGSILKSQRKQHGRQIRIRAQILIQPVLLYTYCLVDFIFLTRVSEKKRKDASKEDVKERSQVFNRSWGFFSTLAPRQGTRERGGRFESSVPCNTPWQSQIYRSYLNQPEDVRLNRFSGAPWSPFPELPRLG